jgi:hypothetical protein
MGDELAAENRASEVKAGGRNLPRKDAPERGSREQVVPQLIPCRSKTRGRLSYNVDARKRAVNLTLNEDLLANVRQNNFQPARCQRISVSGRTTVSAPRQQKSCDSRVRAIRVAESIRRGFTPRSM